MLRLVKDKPADEAPHPRSRRRSAALSLSAEEQRHLRAAIKNIARAYGGMPVLAEVTGIARHTLERVAYKPRRSNSAAVAIRVARAGGMSVEAILSGELSAAGRCDACGARLGRGGRAPT